MAYGVGAERSVAELASASEARSRKRRRSRRPAFRFLRPPDSPVEIPLDALGHAILDGTVFKVRNPRAVRYLARHAAKLVAGIDEATRDTLRVIVRDGVANGRSSQRIARDIIGRFGDMAEGRPQAHIASRAHGIAVTEMSFGYEAGQRAVADEIEASGITMEKSWLTVGDGRVDALCADNAAQGWVPLKDAFGSGDQDPPAHPYCVPGWTVVSGPPANAVSERWWEGQIVVIDTAGGRHLAITPDHLVLTGRGWIAADEVTMGDDLVGSPLGEGETSSVEPNDAQRPAAIAEIARSASESLSVSAIAMPATSEDLDRQGRAGEVDVVGPARLLRRDGEAASLEHLEAPALIGVQSPSTLHRESDPGPVLGSVASPLHGAVGSFRPRSPLLWRPLPRHEPVGGSSPPTLDPMLPQDTPDDVTGDPGLLRKSVLRYAGEVSPDHVVGIRREPFLGHVYNLETVGGWYVAGGLIVHNCRCTALHRTAAEGAASSPTP